jgi:hypothetical protein
MNIKSGFEDQRMKFGDKLPEVTLLYDARGPRPENAAGIGEFWYEPEIWSLPLSPSSKVLYAGLCSFLRHGQINRKDLRGALKNCTDEEITAALQALIRHGLLSPAPRVPPAETLPGYTVRSVKEFDI